MAQDCARWPQDGFKMATTNNQPSTQTQQNKNTHRQTKGTHTNKQSANRIGKRSAEEKTNGSR